ncbi:SDR family oxidoreductase [Parvibaculum sp.]|uniref:SDR family oxidoreductase n=1 Tax=Parvibaculum sp. TaxID=2024848 RepID=UPI001B0D918E|nr:SDR family oxidoreductase [Parvibaculum sp.]MBO6667599.1 SDR family oxidoreductase [Parvibaculum sp.]MBO6693396.1 SDR family oxidoreductase [Parvibaculum sp.]MBO6714150.1 SDR family oxidoreductase [Parvibaculum sp.]
MLKRKEAPVGQEQDHQPGSEAEMDPPPDYGPRYPGSGRLKDKVAVITGGDSGIGRATSILFAREGARIGILYKNKVEEEDAKKTAELVEREGGECFLLSGDVGKKAVAESFVEETVKKFGRLDIVVCGAAEQHFQKNFEEIPEDQILQTFETNVFGQFHIIQAALPHLEKGGSIICVTSVTAYRGQPVLLDYSSTKGAILALVRALSANLAERGIRVNGVAPGPIWTPLIPASFPEEQVATFGKSSPLGRPGQPNEVAPSLLFLACDDSSYMSGQVLHPNGGDLVGG